MLIYNIKFMQKNKILIAIKWLYKKNKCSKQTILLNLIFLFFIYKYYL